MHKLAFEDGYDVLINFHRAKLAAALVKLWIEWRDFESGARLMGQFNEKDVQNITPAMLQTYWKAQGSRDRSLDRDSATSSGSAISNAGCTGPMGWARRQ